MSEIKSKIFNSLNYIIDKITHDSLKKTCAIIFITCIAIAAIITLLIRQIGTYSNLRNDKLFISHLSGYQSQVLLPNCSLYFNKGTFCDAMSNGMFITQPVYSSDDIIKQFGSNPLEGFWIPSHFKSCFSRQKGSNILTDEAVYGSYLLHINIFYRTNPKNIESQTISLIISHGSPYNIAVQSILHSISSEKIKISHIYKTSVTIADMHNESNNTETYAAIFSYKNVGYILSAENGVTQTDFINVLTSIIK
jgi:hypothetical protein